MPMMLLGYCYSDHSKMQIHITQYFAVECSEIESLKIKTAGGHCKMQINYLHEIILHSMT
jgi:hypothetical protein